MPEFYQYRSFYTYVGLIPARCEDQLAESTVYVSESYYGELYLFLECVDIEFDEYEDLRIPMDRWCEALSIWKAFCDASSFDEAFESTAGIDYDTWTIQRPSAAQRLGRSGKSMWEDRKNSGLMLEGLIEWTDLYKDTCEFVDTIGW